LSTNNTNNTNNTNSTNEAALAPPYGHPFVSFVLFVDNPCTFSRAPAFAEQA
jgi:hypothetical protein